MNGGAKNPRSLTRVGVYFLLSEDLNPIEFMDFI
jgi:hypothetical protein